MNNFCHNCGCMQHSPNIPHMPETTEARRTTRVGRKMQAAEKKKDRKPNAHAIAYGKAFKKIEHKYKKKNGGWKKDGFKRCGAAARKMVKKK